MNEYPQALSLLVSVESIRESSNFADRRYLQTGAMRFYEMGKLLRQGERKKQVYSGLFR
ncbi:hypothetical protein JYQ62_19455 [Nostoc sp. UHCC 0702]|nr:hypothetical protein JYQ62_19455 [Nostoc sp. UHCC 0702]